MSLHGRTSGESRERMRKFRKTPFGQIKTFFGDLGVFRNIFRKAKLALMSTRFQWPLKSNLTGWLRFESSSGCTFRLAKVGFEAPP